MKKFTSRLESLFEFQKRLHPVDVRDSAKLRALRAYNEWNNAQFYIQSVDARINERHSKMFGEVDANNQAFFSVWSRDCDCVESTYLLNCHKNDIQKEIDHIEQWAEGPTVITRLTLAEAKDFRASSRDRILEAFEDGRNFSV